MTLVLNPDDTLAIGVDPAGPESPKIPSDETRLIVQDIELQSYEMLNKSFLFYLIVYILLTFYYNVNTLFCITVACIGYVGYRYQLANFIFVFLFANIILDFLLIVCYSLNEIPQTTFIIYSILTTTSIRLIYVESYTT
jgi:hypothetical protein